MMLLKQMMKILASVTYLFWFVEQYHDKVNNNKQLHYPQLK